MGHSSVRTTVTSERITLGPLRAPLMFGGAAVGVVALAAAFFAAGGTSAEGLRSFFSSYLVAFLFCLTIGLGGLFWVIGMHLVRAGWGVCVRRFAEILGMAVLPCAILFLPLLIPVATGSSASIYDWTDPSRFPGFEDLLEHKRPYLNGTFFTVRALGLFAIWGFLGWYFLSASRRQDRTRDPKISLRLQAMAAPAMLAYAFSIVFSSFDWEMSLEPIWFSTIFPVNFFAGCAMASIAVMILMSATLQWSGRLTEDITTDHYHDMGKFAFGFMVFWSYTAFSQYLLIWYANLPEETFWFRLRQENGWATGSIVLMVGHLFVPFFALMPRTLRRHKSYLAIAAVGLLAIHWFDHFWLVMPRFRPEAFEFRAEDFLCLIGVLGLFVSAASWIAGDEKLIAEGDPRLYESLSYHNA